MTTKDLQEYYFEYISQIPGFINTKKATDQKLWDVVFSTSEILSILISNKIFSDKQIQLVSKDFNDLLELVLGLSHQIEVYAYYDSLLHELLNICEVNELFEAAENVNNFYKNNFVE